MRRHSSHRSARFGVPSIARYFDVCQPSRLNSRARMASGWSTVPRHSRTSPPSAGPALMMSSSRNSIHSLRVFGLRTRSGRSPSSTTIFVGRGPSSLAPRICVPNERARNAVRCPFGIVTLNESTPPSTLNGP